MYHHRATNKAPLEHHERAPIPPSCGDGAFHKGRGTQADTRKMSGNSLSEKLNRTKVFQAKRTMKQKTVREKAGQHSWGTENCKQGPGHMMSYTSH